MSGKKLKEGIYRGVLYLNAAKGIELPFNFTVKEKAKRIVLTVHNADERIETDDIKFKGDSVFLRLPVFDTEFRCKRIGNNLEGFWINHYKTQQNIIPFKAVYGESKRFLFESESAEPVFEGKWEVHFSPQTKDSSKAIGVFHHSEGSNYVYGTFLTETGDYRYLEGMKHENRLYLSAFDGSHAFLFTAEFFENKLVNGKFYSGASWEENWLAFRNPDFKLRDPEEITYLRNKDKKIVFNYPNTSGKLISSSDSAFANKVLIIQLMGTWCPNCKDESEYLRSVYHQYKSSGLEIIALAFEKTNDFDKSKIQVERFIQKLNLPYPVLITGQSGKESAGQSLDLDKVNAFPTTLFLNREHQVVKIHSGFSGPATGEEYEIFKRRTENLILSLLKD